MILRYGTTNGQLIANTDSHTELGRQRHGYDIRRLEVRNMKWLSLVFALLIPLGIGIAFATSDNLLLGCFLVSLGFFGYRDAEAGRLDYDARDYE